MTNEMDFLADPAYRIARYNYVWGKDDNAIANYWKDYNTREDKRKADEKLQAEKAKIEADQAEDRYNTNVEGYWTAKTKYDNAAVEYERLVREKGSDSADARKAYNDLVSAGQFLNSYGSKLGLENVEVSPQVTSTAPVKPQVIPAPATATATADKPQAKSTEELASMVGDIRRNITEKKDLTDADKSSALSQLDALRNEQNISEATKDEISKLKVELSKKKTVEQKKAEAKAAAERAKKLQAKINKALDDLNVPEKGYEAQKLLKENGYTVEWKDGKRRAFKNEAK